MTGPKAYGAALLFVISFFLLSITQRSDFGQLIGLYTVLFACYSMALFRGTEISVKQIILLAIAVRIPWFLTLPLLSDDFYRFLWDGLLIMEGVNPFGSVPAAVELSIFHESEFAEHILNMMNSPNYPGVYPPLHQAVFTVGSALSENVDQDLNIRLLAGVNGMRICIILAEAVMFWYFLKSKGLKISLIAAYLLNPLVVAEGIGNVHFEAILTPLLAIALHSFLKGAYVKSAMLWAGTIATKLTPLILAPLLAFRLPPKAFFKFGLYALGFLALAFIWFKPWNLLLADENGLSLYFTTFEFNASVYYLISRTTAYFLGYNPIGILGPALAVLTLIIILLVSYKKRTSDLFEAALVVYIIYYLLATTVHPWYLIPIVFLALASGRRLILIWSFTAWLSYAHYLQPIGAPYILTAFEYLILVVAILVENNIKPWLGNGNPTSESTVLTNL